MLDNSRVRALATLAAVLSASSAGQAPVAPTQPTEPAPVVAPVLLKFVQAPYPEEAARAGIQEDGAAEIYDRAGTEARERLLYSFHTTGGSVGLHAREPETDGGTLDEPRVNWVPPRDNPLTGFEVPEDGMDVTFYVVVRDDRGGAGWTTRKVRVVPEAR